MSDMNTYFRTKAQSIVTECVRRDWDLGWIERGCCLHLESSELTEAMQGKGEDSVASEIGDVLFVLLSIMGDRDIPFNEVLDSLDKKILGLQKNEIHGVDSEGDPA